MAFAERSGRTQEYRLGGFALILSIFTILTALGFQYIGGYVPCMLCYMERYAYYAGMPALFIALILTTGGHRRPAAALFALVALAFLANAGLGIYHSGAEWKFWPGPSTCGGGESLSTSAGGLLKDLQHIKVIKCDEAALRFLGISFAGWNVVASVILMVASLGAAIAAWSQRETD
jgi:disulfide bond formation protein DsbB